MTRSILAMAFALSAAIGMLYGSWWFYENELLEFMGAIMGVIRYAGTQLARLTFAGVAKYLSAQLTRFLTFEAWKGLVIKYIKSSLIPVLLATVLGRKLLQLIAWIVYRLRIGRMLFRKWYRKQHVTLRVFFWAITGVMTLVVTIHVIGFGIIAFAFTFPTWILSLLKSAFIKLWVAVQRVIFRTIMYALSLVGWKKARNRINERHIKRLDRLSADLKKREAAIKRAALNHGKRIVQKLSQKDPLHENATDVHVHLTLLVRGYTLSYRRLYIG